MFFSKLKAIYVLVLAGLVSAGAIGLGYRAAAAPPGQAGSTRPPADELEELRLEVAALRKGLEATRARVKTLESELQTLKGRRAATDAAKGTLRHKFVEVKPFADLDVSVVEQTEAEAALTKLRANPENRQAVEALEKALKAGTAGPASAGAGDRGKARQDIARGFVDLDADGRIDLFVAEQPTAAAALAEAEAALKKLRVNSNDKQAAEALEKALKQLKSQMATNAKEARKQPATP
jgi:hypothetical protein